MSYPYYYVLFDLFLWNYIFFSLLGKIWSRGSTLIPIKRFQYDRYFFLFILYGVFAFHTGDFDHYKDIIFNLCKFNDTAHLEPVYIWFANLCNGNYYMWRLIVWGLSCLFLYWIFKELNTENYISLFFFVTLVLPSFVEGRYVLGLLVYIYGAILTFRSQARWKLIGLLLILISCSFHRSISLLLILYPLYFIHLSKRKIILAVLCFPIFIEIVNLVIDYLFGGSLLSLSIIDENTQKTYLNPENTDRLLANSIGSSIIRILGYIVVGSSFIYILKKYLGLKKPERQFNMLSVAFALAYVLLLFLLSTWTDTVILQRYYLMIPYFFIPLISRFVDKQTVNSKIFYIYTLFVFCWNNLNMLISMYYFSFF